MVSLDRRSVLQLMGVAIISGLAGCIGNIIREDNDFSYILFMLSLIEDPPSDAQIIPSNDERIAEATFINEFLDEAIDPNTRWGARGIRCVQGRHEYPLLTQDVWDEEQQQERHLLEELPFFDEDPCYPEGHYIQHNGTVFCLNAGEFIEE